MSKRALIIGSQTSGLRGVNNDVAAVDALLSQLGFETTLRVDEQARRQEILDAYEKLIEASQEGDAAVVFYSGHGGLAINPDYEEMREDGQAPPRYYQFIVPFDIKESTADDFRGITNIELSLLLARLTNKTKNVTVILDCCHASCMSRDLDMTPKSLPKPWFLGVKAHLAKLVSENEDLELLDVESNPDAVRLVASGVSESAFEYTNDIGERRGLLAESFQLAMEEAEGLDVSWYSLGTRVRERVLTRRPSQRPEVEGPADRLLFQLETADLSGVLPVIVREDEPVLQGGRLMGITAGDRYTIVPQGVEKPTEENSIAEATVRQVGGAYSEIDVYFLPQYDKIPPGANAFPLSTVLPTVPVRVTVDGDGGEQLRHKINASKRLHVAEAGEQGTLATVTAVEGQIDLRDRSDSYSLIKRKPLDETGIAQTVHNLNELARVQVLLNLRSGVGESALQSAYQVEFGRVVDGKAQPIDEAGDVLSVGERAYVKIRNKSPRKTIYCSIFDIGVSGKISLMTRSEPSGVEVPPNQEYILGYRAASGLRGLKLGWPGSVPEDGPRDESVLLIVSDKKQDLRPLQGGGMRGPGEQLSALQKTVDQIGLAVTREFESDEPDVRYAVEHIYFQLSPKLAAARERGVFLIDDRPSLSLLSMAPKSVDEPPSQIAILLKELVVHSNRALFSTEIRLDNMVVTAPAPDNGESFYLARTARFPNIKDGDRLPLDDMLIYHGPVAHFVDMAVWVSRDQKDSLTLADMIKTELNSNDFKVAAGAIAALAIAAPQAALMIGAVAGAGTLIQIGTKLLLQAAGKSIGLYRTSHLAYNQFGVGRHPMQGVMTAQDFSFSYEIVPVA